METKGKNMKPKTDLDKLNEQDWEKYEKMRKVAVRHSPILKIAYYSLATALILLIFYATLHSVTFENLLAHGANYSLNQFNISVHSQVSLMLNYNNTKGINNSTANSLIVTLEKSPATSAAFAVLNFFNSALLFNTLLILLSAIVTFALYWFFFFWFPTLSDTLELPRTFKRLKYLRLQIQKRDENLKAYGYTEQEIAWYHAIRSELIKLELEYQM